MHFSDMARLGISLLLLNLLIYTSESAIARPPNPTDFIKSSCRATRYPVLCVQCLSGYASLIHQSQRQIAIAALSVSISRTRSCSSFVHKLGQETRIKKSREHRAVQDCIENMGDSLDRLRQSVQELGRTGGAAGQEFVWHMSNVQTWVSAALTDQDTCLDGFSGSGSGFDENVKAEIRRRVVNVAQVTSNALALVNRFASRHPS
ncbi:pectinesterase inhibitor 9-like [Neltuma alba]|uniref:pectinesterase inhibitor 9-like n=1 Tax=Neltuma alba TaxID=207710 RepID=UPI0010A5904F|nr:pectinesterase inhibitor 9-like [Prosopis alba]